MTELLNNIHMALPEMIVFALLADLFISQYLKSIGWVLGLTGLVLAGFSSYVLLGQYKVILLQGLFISDDIACLMKIFICLSVFLSLFYSKNYIVEREMPLGDYTTLALFSTLGMMILVSAHSLLTIYLGLELLSLPLYALTAIRRTNADASEAAMKYFVMGAVASGMLLYGISLLYAATGQLDLSEIAHTINTNAGEHVQLLSFSLVFIVAGLGFKLATMPFHMWVPDVYEGAPTSVTLFIGTAPKIAAIAMTLRLLTMALPDITSIWQQLILVMALLSTGLGNLLAIAQQNIKRLLAYSAISHMGYALFGLLAATPSGYAAALYYALVYALMSAAGFGLIVLLSNNGLEIESINDLKGLNKRSPWLAFMMLIVMLSMAGIPPAVGFFAKLLVLKALIDVHMTWVAVLGLVFAVIGAFYYLRIIKVMYFDDSTNASSVHVSKPATLVYSLNCLSLLYFGIFPSTLIMACVSAFN